MEAVITLAGKVDKSLSDAIKDAEKQTESLGGKLKSVLPAAAAAAATAMAKMFAEAIRAGDEFNETMNQLSASTGTYGADLEELKGIALDVYRDNFGESVDDVSQTLATLVQQTDLEGDALERAAESGLMLRDVFGYDIAESTRTADTLMRNFGISADEAYGLMAAGAQNGADKSGELLDTLNEYSSQYAALGMSADEFTQSLIAGAESGAWSIDKVGDAVKEFNLRAKDGSDTTVAAFRTLGLDADEMQSRFAEGGQTAHDAFFQVVDALNSIEDPIARNNAAVNLFGTQFEDLQANVLPALSSVEGASVDAQGALQGIADVRYDSVASSLQGAARQVEAAVLPIFSDAAAKMQEGMAQVGQLASPALMNFVNEIGPPLQSMFDAITPALTSIAQVLLPPLLNLMSALMPIVIQIANVVGGALVAAFQIVSPIIGAVANIFAFLLPIVEGLVTGPLSALVNGLLDGLSSALEWLAGPLSTVQGFFEGVAGAVMSVVDWIGSLIGKLGEVGEAIANSPVGQFVGGIGSMLGFARGGFTNGPYIAGEDPRYPNEAVISFNPAYRAQNLRYWQMAGHMLGAYSASAAPVTAAASGGGTVIDLSGMTYSPKVEVRGNASKDDIVAALRQSRAEFGDFLQEVLAGQAEVAYA